MILSFNDIILLSKIGIGMFGVIGNVTSIFVLAKMAGQNFFDSLLIALTTIDTVFIIFTIVDYSLARGKIREDFVSTKENITFCFPLSSSSFALQYPSLWLNRKFYNKHNNVFQIDFPFNISSLANSFERFERKNIISRKGI